MRNNAVGDFNRDGVPDAYCLKVKNAGSNSLEVHILNGAGNHQAFATHTGTPIAQADAAIFKFAAADFNRGGIADVYYLKVTNTGTNSVEIQVLNGADNFHSFLDQKGSPIAQADAANFQFALGDFDRDGLPDLFCEKVTNTGTHSLEVHVPNVAAL